VAGYEIPSSGDLAPQDPAVGETADKVCQSEIRNLPCLLALERGVQAQADPLTRRQIQYTLQLLTREQVHQTAGYFSRTVPGEQHVDTAQARR
jgi:hypothetical protein